MAPLIACCARSFLSVSAQAAGMFPWLRTIVQKQLASPQAHFPILWRLVSVTRLPPLSVWETIFFVESMVDMDLLTKSYSGLFFWFFNACHPTWTDFEVPDGLRTPAKSERLLFCCLEADHIVPKYGVLPDPAKLPVVMEFQRPEMLITFCSFTDLCSYLRHLASNFESHRVSDAASQQG